MVLPSLSDRQLSWVLCRKELHAPLPVFGGLRQSPGMVSCPSPIFWPCGSSPVQGGGGIGWRPRLHSGLKYFSHRGQWPWQGFFCFLCRGTAAASRSRGHLCRSTETSVWCQLPAVSAPQACGHCGLWKFGLNSFPLARCLSPRDQPLAVSRLQLSAGLASGEGGGLVPAPRVWEPCLQPSAPWLVGRVGGVLAASGAVVAAGSGIPAGLLERIRVVKGPPGAGGSLQHVGRLTGGFWKLKSFPEGLESQGPR